MKLVKASNGWFLSDKTAKRAFKLGFPDNASVEDISSEIGKHFPGTKVQYDSPAGVNQPKPSITAQGEELSSAVKSILKEYNTGSMRMTDLIPLNERILSTVPGDALENLKAAYRILADVVNKKRHPGTYSKFEGDLALNESPVRSKSQVEGFKKSQGQFKKGKLDK